LNFFPENCGAVSDEHGEGFFKTFLQWRRDIKRNGTVLCSPTAAGLWQGMSCRGIQATDKTEKKGFCFF